MPYHIARTQNRFLVAHTMATAHPDTWQCEQNKFRPGMLCAAARDEEMTLKFMLVVKDQTRNLMKMRDARRLDLRVKRVSLCVMQCVVM